MLVIFKMLIISQLLSFWELSLLAYLDVDAVAIL